MHHGWCGYVRVREGRTRIGRAAMAAQTVAAGAVDSLQPAMAAARTMTVVAAMTSAPTIAAYLVGNIAATLSRL